MPRVFEVADNISIIFKAWEVHTHIDAIFQGTFFILVNIFQFGMKGKKRDKTRPIKGKAGFPVLPRMGPSAR